MTSETIQTLENHVTVRDFTDEPLDDETLFTLMQAARRSPSSSNMQTYSLIVVRDPEKKRQFAQIANNQQHIITCPVFVVVCADIARLKQVCEREGKSLVPNLELTLTAVIDAALVGMSLSTAAESLGLGTVMIGAMRNDPARTAELLGLPKGVFAVFGLCIGWPASRPTQKPRLPDDLVIHNEGYSLDGFDEGVKTYNAELAAHYREQGRRTPDAAWTEPIASRVSKPVRPFLREVLETLGFSFD